MFLLTSNVFGRELQNKSKSNSQPSSLQNVNDDPFASETRYKLLLSVSMCASLHHFASLICITIFVLICITNLHHLFAVRGPKQVYGAYDHLADRAMRFNLTSLSALCRLLCVISYKLRYKL